MNKIKIKVASEKKILLMVENALNKKDLIGLKHIIQESNPKNHTIIKDVINDSVLITEKSKELLTHTSSLNNQNLNLEINRNIF